MQFNAAVSEMTSQHALSVILKRSLCTLMAICRANSRTFLFSSANASSSMWIPVWRQTLQSEQQMSHTAFNINSTKKYKKKAITMTEYVSEFPENIVIYSQGRALITSSDEHVAHLMKAGHKCNKAAKVIRSATSHFAAAHTPHIGLWREIWWTAEVELAHLQRTREGLMACDCIHSHINSDGRDKPQQSVWAWCWKAVCVAQMRCVKMSKTTNIILTNGNDQIPGGPTWLYFQDFWWINTNCSSNASTHTSGSEITRHSCYFDLVKIWSWGWKPLKPAEGCSNTFSFLSLKLPTCCTGQKEPFCRRAPLTARLLLLWLQLPPFLSLTQRLC